MCFQSLCRFDKEAEKRGDDGVLCHLADIHGRFLLCNKRVLFDLGKEEKDGAGKQAGGKTAGI